MDETFVFWAFFKAALDPDSGVGGTNTRIEDPQPAKIFQRYRIELEGVARPAVGPPRYTGTEGVVELLSAVRGARVTYPWVR